MARRKTEHRWIDDIKTDLGVVGWGGVGRIYLAEMEVSHECGSEFSGSIKYLKVLE
jgi:hypothetical protein